MTNITTTDIGNIKDGHLNLGGVALTTWEQWEPTPGIENRRHPWNLALPPKSDEEIQTQRERVERDGQLSDILVHSDMLFDGYYELMACMRFNIKPRFRDITAEYVDEGLLRLWADRNFHPGRHTTDSQRAAIAYCIHEGIGAFMSEQGKLSIPQVAAMLKVSRQTLDNVRNALNVSKCPALIELLLANTISVHAAQKAAPTLAKMSNEDRSAKVKSLMAAGKTANRKHSAAGEQSDSEKKPEPTFEVKIVVKAAEHLLALMPRLAAFATDKPLTTRECNRLDKLFTRIAEQHAIMSPLLEPEAAPTEPEHEIA